MTGNVYTLVSSIYPDLFWLKRSGGIFSGSDILM